MQRPLPARSPACFLGAFLVLLACGDPLSMKTRNPWPASEWTEDDPQGLVEYLAELGPPALLSIHQLPASIREIAAARAGRFSIQEKPADVTPPVDWLQDPYDDRSWRFWLHSLVVLEPLLQGYEKSRDPTYLERSLDIVVDWLRRNPRGGRGVSRFAWYDMAVPARAAYMGYLLRASAVAGVLQPSQAVAIGRGLEDHADWLADDSNYTAGHNHGLYQDAGLFLAARQLPDHPRAESWRATARRRFEQTLRATVAMDEGMHLEHSPTYHVMITELLNDFIGLGLGSGLEDLVERMRNGAGWLAMPDDRHPQLGDTDRTKVPRWVRRRSRAVEGLGLFEAAGFGIVKTPDAYLILAAGYHGRGHKHADELTLSLYDRGRRVLVDSGRWGYYYDEPERIYAVSSRAHNGVEFGGQELVWRDREPYGSGILGGAAEGGWYGLAAVNPLLEERGIDHRRLLLYRPGRQLVIIDRGRVPEPTSVTRYLHFSPKLRPRHEEGFDDPEPRRVLGGDGFDGWVCDLSERPVVTRLVGAQRHPELQGFTFPANRVARESPTLILEGHGGSGDWVTALDMLPGGGICAGELALDVVWNGEAVRVGRPEVGPSLEVRVETAEAPGAGPMRLEIRNDAVRSEGALR